MVANDNGDKVVGGKADKGALLLMCRSVGQTSLPMLPLSTQKDWVPGEISS